MKVLFFHYADYLEYGIPGGIAALSSLLKENGYKTRLFDTTFLKPPDYQPVLKGGPAIFKKTAYTLEDLVEKDPVVDLRDEFSRTLQSYRPNLLAVSAMTTNYDETLDLLKAVNPECPVIMGGVHPTLMAEDILKEDIVDAVCVGEGEGALLDLCNALERDKDPKGIPNLLFKSNARPVGNCLRPFVDLDELPVPDWELFDERHLFRPFEGEIYKGSFLTTSRGCPGACTYCVNETLRKMTRACGSYYRRQDPAKTIRDVCALKDRYGATWFKFADDTFLQYSIKELEVLRDGLRKLAIKFGCSVQPTTITEEKVRLAREMGCVAMSIGIESGNEEMRRKILNRKISNQSLERGIRMVMDSGIRVSTFNMIGLPGETRENVFETIRFNKKLGIKAANVYILYPFPETHIARANGTKYLNEKGRMIPMSEAAAFNLSRMGRQELEGLRKTFNLYLILPDRYWPEIRCAEGRDEQSQKVFEELTQLAATYV